MMQQYQRIQNSLMMYEKPVGNVRLYKRVLKHCNDNERMADAFMLSSYGLFTKKDLGRIKSLIKYHKKKYKNKKDI